MTLGVLHEIVAQFGQINRVVGEIAGSVQEQALVNTAVNQMDHVIQQNAAMVEEGIAASHGLESEAIPRRLTGGGFIRTTGPG